MIANKIKKKLIDKYSICKNEFCVYEPFSTEKMLYYHSKITKYMIVIEEEEQHYEKTGRISVKHIDEKGHIQFEDIFYVEDNEPVFLFRNKQGYNKSDADIISDLEQEIKELKKKGRELREQLHLSDSVQESELNIIKLQRENRQLKAELNEVLQQYQASDRRKKPGRKNKFSQEKIREILREVNSGVPKTQIAEKYGCTRRTLYKIIENNK